MYLGQIFTGNFFCVKKKVLISFVANPQDEPFIKENAESWVYGLPIKYNIEEGLVQHKLFVNLVIFLFVKKIRLKKISD